MRCVLAVVAAQVFVVDIEVDGVVEPLPFLADDNLSEVASQWATRRGLVGVVDSIRREMAQRVRPEQGEGRGCPAGDDPPPDMPPELVPVLARARSWKRLVVSMISGAYARFGVSWARSLLALHVDFLIVCLDDIAMRALDFIGDRAVRVTAAYGGRDAVETFGSSGFKNVTSLKPSLVRWLHKQGIDVLYADADVVFLRDPWPFVECPVQIQPVPMHGDLARAIDDWDNDPRNPRPRERYFGKAVCSGLAAFQRGDVASELLDRWDARSRDPTCGGDQAALEAAVASMPSSRICALRLDEFPHGMALRALGLEPKILRHEPPANLVAIHFNFVVGGPAKEAWMRRLGLWYGD